MDTLLLTKISKKIKYLEINLIKELKVCYSANFKLRKKEIKILENGYHAWKSNVHMKNSEL